MKRTLSLFSSLAVCAALLAALSHGGAGGCGSATGLSSPPVNIPAPVAGLISVTTPDAEGFVRVTGASNASSSNTRIDVTLESLAALTLKNQAAGDLLGSVDSQSDGSFVLDVQAQVGNIIRVQQEGEEDSVDGPLPTLFEIRPGRILVPVTPVGAAISPSFGIAQTVQPSGGSTVIDIYSTSTLTPSGTDAVASGIQATDFVLDDGTQETYLISVGASEVRIVDFGGNLVGSILPLDSPVSIATAFGLSYAAVGQDSPTSITLVDNSAFPSLDASITIPHPIDGGASHVATPAIAMDQDTFGNDKIAAVSNFDNGDSVFSYLDVTPPTGGSIGVNSQISLGGGTYDSVVLFNAASEALVTDTGNDRLIHMSGSGFSTGVHIPVGDGPRGVAVYGNRAFVCNRADHTVSIVDLDTDAVIAVMTTSYGVGLNPTDIAFNPSVPDVGMITNQGDDTVTVFDVSDLYEELGI